MHQFLPYAWFGGRCVPFAEATISVATHALHYGTGAFGGMRALLLNSRGKVSEASGMNLFIVRDGVLITPGVDQDILEGITRASVLEIAQAMGIPTLERPVDKTELFVADEVFLSGTAARVTPVRRVENTDMPSQRPVMAAIRDRLTAITEGRDPAYDHWVTRVRLDG